MIDDAHTEARRRHLARLRARLDAAPRVTYYYPGDENPWSLRVALALLLLALMLLAGWWS